MGDMSFRKIRIELSCLSDFCSREIRPLWFASLDEYSRPRVSKSQLSVGQSVFRINFDGFFEKTDCVVHLRHRFSVIPTLIKTGDSSDVSFVSFWIRRVFWVQPRLLGRIET